MWQGWVNLVLGIWLIFSAFLPELRFSGNLFVVGFLMIVYSMSIVKEWRGRLMALLGLWAFISAGWYDIATPANFLVVGLIVGGCGLWCGLTHQKAAI